VVPPFIKEGVHYEHCVIAQPRDRDPIMASARAGARIEWLSTNSTSVQLPLFDLPEPEHIEPVMVAVWSHDRKKPGRKALSPELPRVEIVHDLPEEDKICGCGCALSRIGEEVSE